MQYQELVGLAEVAELFGVTRQAVANWRGRHTDFPAPAVELKSGPVWQLDTIQDWAALNGHELQEKSEQQLPISQPVKTATTANISGIVSPRPFRVGLNLICAFIYFKNRSPSSVERSRAKCSCPSPSIRLLDPVSHTLI